jgi:8-oxo-dGTP pyrophosphatase MutT (NUDIX family)
MVVSLGVADLQVRNDRIAPVEGEPMPTMAEKKEPTASALVFSRFVEGWRLCLIMHPRLRMLLPAGGHVEADETTAEAAVREVLEETGLAARLVHPSSMPLPLRTPHLPVPVPWWILEMRVPPDRHEPTQHIHVDSIYVAVADHVAAGPGAHQVTWLSAAELAEHPGVVEDTRVLAKEVFSRIDDLVTASPGHGAGYLAARPPAR